MILNTNKEISFQKKYFDLRSKRLKLSSIKYSDIFLGMKDSSYNSAREFISNYNKENDNKIEMTSAYIEYLIQKNIKDIWNSDEYKMLFDKNSLFSYLMTSTALRIEKSNKKPAEPDLIKKGRKYWIRVLLEGDREVREVKIPDDGYVLEFDDETGLPAETEKIKLPHKNKTLFSFWSDPIEDMYTKERDVPVFYQTCLKSACGKCIDIDTMFSRDLLANISFRPIALPETMKVKLKNTDIVEEMTLEEYDLYRSYGGQGAVL